MATTTTKTTTTSTTHILDTGDLLYYESDISSAQLNRTLVHSLTCLLHSFNFFVSLHWPILLLISLFLSRTQCARFASLHRTMARLGTNTYIMYVCTHRFIFVVAATVVVIVDTALCTFHFSYRKKKCDAVYGAVCIRWCVRTFSTDCVRVRARMCVCVYFFYY